MKNLPLKIRKMTIRNVINPSKHKYIFINEFQNNNKLPYSIMHLRSLVL